MRASALGRQRHETRAGPGAPRDHGTDHARPRGPPRPAADAVVPGHAERDLRGPVLADRRVRGLHASVHGQGRDRRAGRYGVRLRRPRTPPTPLPPPTDLRPLCHRHRPTPGLGRCRLVVARPALRHDALVNSSASGEIAADQVDYATHINGQEWRTAWHPPAGAEAPAGRPHGAEAVCVADGNVVMVSQDGARWGLPAGRPEPGEDWAATMRREVLEEACAEIVTSRLLGFSRGVCVRGHEQGLVLVRSLWRAEVRLLPWAPRFEMSHRRLVPHHAVFSSLAVPPGLAPFYRRLLTEAAAG
ncbi:MAG: NUDIX domain-containing protein [Streptosporangiales bacterium]|nr:NUDIX domain-containing protein [Streptosporangiales bacterium]